MIHIALLHLVLESAISPVDMLPDFDKFTACYNVGQNGRDDYKQKEGEMCEEYGES